MAAKQVPKQPPIPLAQTKVPPAAPSTAEAERKGEASVGEWSLQMGRRTVATASLRAVAF